MVDITHNRWLARRGAALRIILDICLLCAVGLPTLYLFLKGTPVHGGFHCDDPSLSYPYRPSTVSTPVLLLVGLSIGAFVVIVVEVLNCLDSSNHGSCWPDIDNVYYCTKGYAVFYVGFNVEDFVVELVKNQMGSLRPNFFDVCQPQFNRSECPGFITEYTCTGSEHGADELRDIRQSFPSGHSAFSMYIATYFCLYIQQRLQISYSRLLKFFLQAGLVCLSLLCGLLRIHDNKHHPCDVIAGFLHGAIVAVAIYNCIARSILSTQDDQHGTKVSKSVTLPSENMCCACAATSSINDYSETSQENGYVTGDGSGMFHDSHNKSSKLKDIPFMVLRDMSIPADTGTGRREEV